MSRFDGILDGIYNIFGPTTTQRDYALVGEHASTATDLPDTVETEQGKLAREAAETERNRCKVCGNQAQVQSFKGTGYCSENHRKILQGDFSGPGWHNTVVLRLADPNGRQLPLKRVRFTLPDPFQIFEGELYSVTILPADDDRIERVQIILMKGWQSCWPNQEGWTEHPDQTFTEELAPYKVIEVEV